MIKTHGESSICCPQLLLWRDCAGTIYYPEMVMQAETDRVVDAFYSTPEHKLLNILTLSLERLGSEILTF